MCINNTYGTICDDFWDHLEAAVVCRKLGFSTLGSIPLKEAEFGQGSGKILLSNVNCNGTESSLLDCPVSGVSQKNCNHSEDAAVRCEGL